jgi:hypothetical protein
MTVNNMTFLWCHILLFLEPEFKVSVIFAACMHWCSYVIEEVDEVFSVSHVIWLKVIDVSATLSPSSRFGMILQVVVIVYEIH